jgi:hypothetical protein
VVLLTHELKETWQLEESRCYSSGRALTLVSVRVSQGVETRQAREECLCIDCLFNVAVSDRLLSVEWNDHKCYGGNDFEGDDHGLVKVFY